MKQIHIHYINKIKRCKLRIFEAEDNYVFTVEDKAVVTANERAIEHWLKKANITNEEERRELLNIVDWSNDNCSGALEKLGWTILRGKELL